MTPQDFKALLESLNRIGTALEAKSGNSAVMVVNRFSVVLRMLKNTRDAMVSTKFSPVAEKELTKIIKTYTRIAEEVLNEDI